MQHIWKFWGNEKCLNNFKSSINKNNHLSAVKFPESIGNTNVDDVMIKIHGLHVYYADASRKKEWVLDH